MGNYKIKLFFLSIFLCSQIVTSQDLKQYSFRDLTVNEGLSQNSVVSIAQDSIGYIWFATQDGLNQYDGRNFIYHNRQFKDVTRKNYSHLGQIYTDNFGDFWIYSQNGFIERYDYKSKTFKTFTEHKDVNLIYRPQQKKLWYSSLNKGLFEVDFYTKTKKPLFENELFNKTVFDIITYNDGHLLATSNGIYQTQDSKLKSRFNTKDIPVSSLSILDNTLIVGTYGKGIFYFNLKTEEKLDEWSTLFPSDLNVQDIIIDSKSRLWIATYGNGVFLKEPQNKIVRHFEAQKEDPYALHYNDVLKIFEDNTGVIWFGTDGSGLSFYDETLVKFNIKTNDQTSANVNVDVIRAIAVSDKTIWLGTSGKGLTSINRTSNQDEKTYTDTNSELKGNRIMSLLLQDNRLWIGHQGFGLQYFENNSFKNIPEFNNKTIWKIASNDQNYIWVATRNSGLFQFNFKTNSIKNWNTNNSNIKTNNIRTFDFNTDGTYVFIGSGDNGVYILNTKTNTIKPVEHLEGGVKSLLFNNNKLYVGTNGNGIKIWNLTSNEINFITKKDGLSNAVIYGILLDESQNIWISSNRGISKIELTNAIPKITNYSNYDGLQSFEFNTGAYAKADDGTLFFGGLEGLNWFKPSQIQQNTSQPKTVISNIDLFNTPLEEEKSIFKHSENTLAFTFSSLQFSQPERNLYQYQLVPHDAKWLDNGNVNSAHYTNLEPNDYTFSVKSSNYDGVWNDNVASFPFQIKNPWYKTNIAFIVYAFLLLLVLYAIYSYFKFKWKLQTQVRLEHAETERLQQLDRFKTQLYTNISHEFRTPLTLISGPIDKQLTNKYLKQNDRKDLQLVKQNAMRLLGLVNQMMDLSLIDAGQIKLKIEQGNLGIILKQLVLAFQYKANEKNINIKSTIAELDNSWFDKDIIEKISSNLLSNAVKYSPEKSTIYFIAQQQNNQLQLSVVNQNNQIKADKLGQLFQRFYQDNEASEGIGVGLALVKDLVTLSKGTILANTYEENKIQFSITLPIEKDAFEEFELIKTAEEVILSETNKTAKKDQPTIVIIDDEADILNFVASIFKNNYSIIKTTNSVKALDLIRKQLPDLVISDIMMPNIDGLELCNQLKKDIITSHIPIILLTAKVTQSQKLEGLETGADAYVTKPFNADILKVRVNKLIETRAQLKQRFNEQPILTKALEVTSVEAEFMQRLKDVLDKHLVNPEFTTDAFGKYMLMSRTQLHRKLKAIVGMTTSEFIRSQRMLLARDILKKQNISISEAAYLVGFNSVSYFIKCFKKSYNETPSQYLERYNS